MKPEQVHVVQECARLSAAGEIGFGDVIVRLAQAGIERYHADYSRGESTFYAVDGASCVVPMRLDIPSIAAPFAPDGVEAAVRQAQRGEIRYKRFTELAVAAGCVGYFVQLAGRCVQYFGRLGEIHTEWFPGAGPNTVGSPNGGRTPS